MKPDAAREEPGTATPYEHRAFTTFLLRLSQGSEGFHALVRHVSCEQGIEFVDVESLGRFLAAAARALPAECVPPKAGPP